MKNDKNRNIKAYNLLIVTQLMTGGNRELKRGNNCLRFKDYNMKHLKPIKICLVHIWDGKKNKHKMFFLNIIISE